MYRYTHPDGGKQEIFESVNSLMSVIVIVTTVLKSQWTNQPNINYSMPRLSLTPCLFWRKLSKRKKASQANFLKPESLQHVVWTVETESFVWPWTCGATIVTASGIGLLWCRSGEGIQACVCGSRPDDPWRRGHWALKSDWSQTPSHSLDLNNAKRHTIWH